MLENFNGPIYLILFIILLLANLYYAYSTLINTKNWLDKYGTHHSAVLLTRILGSFNFWVCIDWYLYSTHFYCWNLVLLCYIIYKLFSNDNCWYLLSRSRLSK